MSRLESDRLRAPSVSKKSEKQKVKSWDASQKQAALQEFDESFISESQSLSSDLQKLFENAKLLLRSGEYHLAKRVFLAVLQKQPSFDPAHHGLLQSLHALGDQTAVVNHLENRVEAYPSFSSFFDLAEYFYHCGENDKAEELYAEALQYPHVEGSALFSIYKNLGNLALQRRDFAAAEEQYSKAFTLDDRSDVLLVNFGSLAIQRGQIERALSCYRQAIELNPSNPKAWIGLAVLHREFGDYELSWANVERALDFEPGNPTAAKLIAEWGLKDNEFEKTIRLLQNYLEVQSGDAFQHMILGKYLYFAGRMQAAAEHLGTACELDPNLEEAKSIQAIINEEITKAGL